MTKQEKEIYVKTPLAIIRDKRLTPVEKTTLCLIAGLQNKKECWSSNNWFGDYFGITRQAAQQRIKKLVNKGFIRRTEIKSGRKTTKRILEIIDPDSKQSLLTISKERFQEMASNPCRDSKQRYTQIINNKRKDKIKAEALPLPAKGQARPLSENERIEACKDFKPLKKKLGMSTDHQPLDGQEFEQKQQDQIKKLYA